MVIYVKNCPLNSNLSNLPTRETLPAIKRKTPELNVSNPPTSESHPAPPPPQPQHSRYEFTSSISVFHLIDDCHRHNGNKHINNNNDNLVETNKRKNPVNRNKIRTNKLQQLYTTTSNNNNNNNWKSPISISQYHSSLYRLFANSQQIICIVLLMFTSLSQASTNGTSWFELQLISLRNDRGLFLDGTCCSGSGNCSSTCNVYFRICLNNFQVVPPPNPECKFGSFITELHLGQNTVTDLQLKIVQFPLHFVWPGDFLLVIQAFHKNENSSHVQTSPRNHGNDEFLIHKAVVNRRLNPSEQWTKDVSSSGNSTLGFQFRVKCMKDQYGPGCSVTCIPRDDLLGHYECRPEDGKKVCKAGWKEEYCRTPICDCHAINGICVEPGVCKCKSGWEGPKCDVCQKYPGCMNGYCIKGNECNCNQGYGGNLCNQDLNFCSNHKPCINGGICSNSKSGSYICHCLPGYNGTNCEIELEDCRQIHQTCVNGTCESHAQQHKCRCHDGFDGRRCEVKTGSTCDDHPCWHNATCEKSIFGNRHYLCLCQSGFRGHNCEENINECSSQPCLHGGQCVDGLSLFTCVCPPGYSGGRCEKLLNFCASKPCQNEGRCLDIGAGKCECKTGFTGEFCHVNIDDCLLSPCANGGTCEDLVNSYRCICTPGFTGRTCQTKFDLCAGRPCLNGATCVASVDTFKCHCIPGFQGNSCEVSVATHWTSTSMQSSVDENRGNLPQIIVAIVIGSLIPVILAIVLLIVLLFFRRRRRLEKEQEREKNRLAVISNEEVDNDFNHSLNLNNKKDIKKSSQKIGAEEVNLFIKYAEDEAGQQVTSEPADLRLHSNFQRNLLNVDKYRHHRTTTNNDSNVYRAKVPTKYKQINYEVVSKSGQSRHTEV